MELEKAIEDLREKVRGIKAPPYLRKNRKKIMSQYDLDPEQYWELFTRLRNEQLRGSLPDKKEEVPADSK